MRSLAKLFQIILFSLLLISCVHDEKRDSVAEIQNLSGPDWFVTLTDKKEYALENYNHSKWIPIEVPFNLRLAQPNHRGSFWLRRNFEFDKSNIKKNLSITLGKIYNSDEVFINGVLIGSNGKRPDEIESNSLAYNRLRVYPLPLNILHQGTNVIAIRITSDFSNYAGIVSGELGISSMYSAVDYLIYDSMSDMVYVTVFLFIGIFFLINYFKMPEMKEYLMFSLFIIIFSGYEFCKNEFRFLLSDNFLIYKYFELFFLFNIPFFYILFFQSFFKINPLKYQNYYFLTNLLIVIIFAIFRNPSLWSTVTSIWSFHLILPLGYTSFYSLKKLKDKNLDSIIFSIAVFYFMVGVIKEVLIEKGFLNGESAIDGALLFFILLITLTLRIRFIQLKLSIKKRFEQLQELDKLRERLFHYMHQILIEPIESSLRLIRAMKTDLHIASKDQFEKIENIYEEIDNSLDDILELSRLEVKENSPLKDTVNFVDFIKTIIPENQITYTIKVDPAFQIHNTLDLVNSLMIRIIDFDGFQNFTSKDLIITSDLKDHLHFRFMFFHKDPRVTQNLYKQLLDPKIKNIEIVRWVIITQILRLLDGKLEMGLINKKYLRIDFELLALPLEKTSNIEPILDDQNLIVDDTNLPNHRKQFNWKSWEDWKQIEIKLPDFKELANKIKKK